VKEYSLIPDSGGAGEYRGGMGVAREITILHDNTTFSGRADSYKTQALGHNGGGSGGNCRIVRNYETTEEEVMPPKQRLLVLKAGESIRLETPGGGGFGPPQQRTPNQLAQDLVDDRFLLKTAQKKFGENLLKSAEKLI